MTNRYSNEFYIGDKKISNTSEVYFVADIAANHDGDINRAKRLIYLAAESGADAAKFQHFSASKIASNEGFVSLGQKLSHQKEWKKSVYEVYSDAEVKLDWTLKLKETCDEVGITFFSSPYDFEVIDYLDEYVPAYKIGSGDITWIEIIEHIASKKKPYLIATGASNLIDVQRAVEAGVKINPEICLMQCNTNYTGSTENFRYINLNVLRTYQTLFPGIILGLSDHTPGMATVLGAVSIGARVIEKHFTDDTSRVGPDHLFSMDPASWREMVNRTRELENSLGDGIKRIENNESSTSILQRRGVYAVKNLKLGSQLTRGDLAPLRPCPPDAIPVNEIDQVLNKRLINEIGKGEYLKWSDLE